jgi:AraC family transcriptional regulator of arabinose operon
MNNDKKDNSEFCKQQVLQKVHVPLYMKNVLEARRLLDDLIASLEEGYSNVHILYANLTLQRVMALMNYEFQEHEKDVNRLSVQVITFMKENIKAKFNLADLASSFSYSTSQFSCIFKKETGYSPIDYFIRLKILHACDLLHSTSLKIYEVAGSIGYNDPYHFSKLFKLVMKVSPDQYRLLITNRNAAEENFGQK